MQIHDTLYDWTEKIVETLAFTCVERHILLFTKIYFQMRAGNQSAERFLNVVQ